MKSSKQKKEVLAKGRSSFFLSDNKGGYFSLGMSSQYQGWFTFLENELELFKIFENIRLKHEPDKVETHKNYAVRRTRTATESIFLNKNRIDYEIEGYKGEIELELDFRKIHDYSDQGRIYEIKSDKKNIIIKYTKYSDGTLTKKENEFFLAIKGAKEYKEIKEWKEKNYLIDEKRKVKSKLYTFSALNIHIPSVAKQKIVFGFGLTKKDALANATKLRKKLRKEWKTDIEISQTALSNFIIKLQGQEHLLAGLPWFYQVWSRDEMISLGGLIEFNPKLAKNILMNNLNRLNTKGALPNRMPDSELSSADGTGWLYKRASQLNTMNKFTKLQKEFLLEKIKKTIEKSRQEFLTNGLIKNGPKETWMDTTTPELQDERKGFRVEIQALHLNMYKLAKELSKDPEEKKKYEEYETSLKNAVLELMTDKDILLDGLEENMEKDYAVRPNIFLAHYIYPELLTVENWKKTFDKTLENCWLKWGGLSTISKKHALFQERHTGINNRSYHRGDSWYFVNNLAAISLLRTDRKIYKRFAEKIYEASVKEMKSMGFLGQCSEISSALTQESQGCMAQAWSAGTLIELMRNI